MKAERTTKRTKAIAPQPRAKGRRLRLEWVEAGSLTPNPDNWRRHPEHQTAALRESLDDVGWAGALLFNEKTGRLIDGHARRDGAKPDELVPVLVGSWTPEQERRILATLDPLAALAEPDPVALCKLLDSIDFDSIPINEMLLELRAGVVLPDSAAGVVYTAACATKVKMTTCPGCGHEFAL